MNTKSTATRTRRTAARVLLAAPLAVAALSIGGFAGLADAAHADNGPMGPGTITLPVPGGDPEPQGGDFELPTPAPQPQPAPLPEGPGDFSDPTPTPDPHPHPQPQPEGPGDLTAPDDGPRPGGPDDIAIPDPKDNPGQPTDPGQEGGQVPGQDTGTKPGKKPAGKPGKHVDEPQVEAHTDSVPVPTRIDAGAAAAPVADEGTELGWLLAGGGVLTAIGSALVGVQTRRIRGSRH